MALEDSKEEVVAVTVQKEEKKKKKKKKKKMKEQKEKMENKVETEVNDSEEKKKKKKKKKKKQPENTQDIDEKLKKKKEKKKNKKNKKRKAQAIEPENEPTAAITESKKDKKKKKKKKNKSGESVPTVVSTFENKMTIEEIKEFQKENRITVNLNENESLEDFAPLTTFEVAKQYFPAKTKVIFDACCGTFTKPSPIQAQSWGIIEQGRDLVGVAATGSGKTLAFVLPGMSKLINDKLGSRCTSSNGCSPRCLVISPTRELAIQSAKVAEEACTGMKGFSALVVFGGNPKREQINQLRGLGKDLDFLVATPGRLLDFVEGGEISLGFVKYLVLDEADRMLDMGFEKEVKRIISQTNSDRQTVMFSATWPEEIRAVARSYMNNPIRIVVGSDKLSASKSVTQHVEVMEPFAKERRLRNLLQEIHDGNNKIIIFGLYKKECARLEDSLVRQGFKVSGIHGDKTQSAREAAIKSFETGKTSLLVATDVASRGLDIEGVEYVINYTFPLTVEDYVHRIGRTGRAGRTGIAHTFFTSHEKHLAGALQNVLRQAGAKIPEDLAKFGNTVKKKEHKLYGAHFRSFDGPMKKATRITFD